MMNKGGSLDLGWVKITMTNADHSSSCGFHKDEIVYGGQSAGWIIRFPECDLSVYHAGDTGVFSDMKMIDELYKPQYVILPIGSTFTMGPEEAAFAVKNYFKHAHTVIPMHYATFPALTGTFEGFQAEMSKLGVLDKQLINPFEQMIDKWLDLKV